MEYILRISEKEKRMLEWMLNDVRNLVVAVSDKYTGTQDLIELRNKVVWAKKND